MTKTAAAGAQVILLTLAAGQFLMALDSSVMNVSIATVAEDVGTTVTGIQGAITAYTLVMAMLMIPGAKVGALIGRKRAFMIGCVIYGCGSFTTALSQSLPVLLFGWSFLEGVGAALILPSIVALVAGNFPAARRPAAYGLVAAAGAIAIAVGPLIGGLATTYASWRWVFAGEVILVLVILLLARRAEDAPPDRRPKIDLVGAVLCAAGLGVFVFGVLKSGSWGWVAPKSGAPAMVRNVAGAVADGRRARAGLVVSALGGAHGRAGRGAARRSGAAAQRAARGRADHVLLSIPPDDGGLLPAPALPVGGARAVGDRHRGSDPADVR